MYNFYQSTIRKTINQDIAHKPVGVISLFGKEYQYIIREKKKGPMSLCWIQILGIIGINNHTISEWKGQLQSVVKKHNPLFIQFGSIDVLATISYDKITDKSTIEETINTRNTLQNGLTTQGRTPSIKENMPPSTYIVDITNSSEERRKKLGSQHTTKIKKAQKNGIIIREAQGSDKDTFFTILQQTGKTKGFNVIGKSTYYELLKWLEKNNTGKLYIAVDGNEIVAGAIYLTDYSAKIGIYLYGGTNSQHRNSGASQLLHREIMNILQNNGIESIDLLGGGPTGIPKHHLTSVGIFKEGFGGNKIDYIGSYDIVYRSIIYKIRKTLRLLSN